MVLLVLQRQRETWGARGEGVTMGAVAGGGGGVVGGDGDGGAGAGAGRGDGAAGRWWAGIWAVVPPWHMSGGAGRGRAWWRGLAERRWWCGGTAVQWCGGAVVRRDGSGGTETVGWGGRAEAQRSPIKYGIYDTRASVIAVRR